MTATVDSSGSAAPRARAQHFKKHGARSSLNQERNLQPVVQTNMAVDIDRAAAALISTRHAVFDIHVSRTPGYRSSINICFRPEQITKADLQKSIASCSASIAEAAILLWHNQMGPFRPLALSEHGVGGTTVYGDRSCRCWVSIIHVNLLEGQLQELPRTIERVVVNAWQNHFKRQRKWRKADKAAALASGGAA